MHDALSGGWLTNGVSIAAFLIFTGFVGKQVIDWFRGNKRLETEFRSTTISDAIEGHQVLKGMFGSLKAQVEDLETDLKQSKEREARLIAEHRREMFELRRSYEEQLHELRVRLAELEAREKD